jgi:hypothetical protein
LSNIEENNQEPHALHFSEKEKKKRLLYSIETGGESRFMHKAFDKSQVLWNRRIKRRKKKREAEFEERPKSR